MGTNVPEIINYGERAVEEEAAAKGTCKHMRQYVGCVISKFSPTAPDVGDKSKCKTLSVVVEEVWPRYTLKTECKLKYEIPICVA